MAIIKHISVKRTPLATLEYIAGKKKSEKVNFITGLNCSKDAKYAYEEMKICYEYFSGEKFDNEEKGKGKQKIRLHHYVQSFEQGEVTAEQAHEIAVKWAKAAFGDNRQILICTHEDTDNIHTHIAVNSYDLDGNHWISNKATLKECRDKSDIIVKSYGLSVINNPKNEHNHNYGEHLARQNGTSWKANLCADIDRLVLQDNVKNIDALVCELKKMNYEVTLKKYLSIKPTDLKNRKAIRSYRLGDGYSVPELEYRIKYKNREMDFADIHKLTGIQTDYALCLKISQRKAVSSKRRIEISYRELCRSAEILSYICDNNIRTKQEFEKKVIDVSEKADSITINFNKKSEEVRNLELLVKKCSRYFKLQNKDFLTKSELSEYTELDRIAIKYGVTTKEELEKTTFTLSELQSELEKIRPEYENAVKDKKDVTEFYSDFIRLTESDYERELHTIKAELEEYEKNLPTETVTEEDYIRKEQAMVHFKEMQEKKKSRDYGAR